MAAFDAVGTAIVAVYRTLILVSSHSSKTIGTAVDKVAAADFVQLLWHCICENYEIEQTKMFGNVKNWLGTLATTISRSMTFETNGKKRKKNSSLLTLVKIHSAMSVRRPVCQPIDPMHYYDADTPNRLCSNYCNESNLLCCRSLV